MANANGLNGNDGPIGLNCNQLSIWAINIHSWTKTHCGIFSTICGNQDRNRHRRKMGRSRSRSRSPRRDSRRSSRRDSRRSDDRRDSRRDSRRRSRSRSRSKPKPLQTSDRRTQYPSRSRSLGRRKSRSAKDDEDDGDSVVLRMQQMLAQRSSAGGFNQSSHQNMSLSKKARGPFIRCRPYPWPFEP